MTAEGIFGPASKGPGRDRRRDLRPSFEGHLDVTAEGIFGPASKVPGVTAVGISGLHVRILRAASRKTGLTSASEAPWKRREKRFASVHPSKEEGNAAATVLGIGVVVLLVVSGLTDIGIFFLARARAQTAADAAALAAAAELIPGLGGDPEGEAKRFASANGARLVECECRMGSEAAQVEVRAPAEFFMVFRATKTEIPARARAGIHLDVLRNGASTEP